MQLPADYTRTCIPLEEGTGIIQFESESHAMQLL